MAIAGGVLVAIILISRGFDFFKGIAEGLAKLGAGLVDYVQTMAQYPVVAGRAILGMGDLITGGGEEIAQEAINVINEAGSDMSKAIEEGDIPAQIGAESTAVGSIIATELATVLEATGIVTEGAEVIVKPYAEAYGSGVQGIAEIGEMIGVAAEQGFYVQYHAENPNVDFDIVYNGVRYTDENPEGIPLESKPIIIETPTKTTPILVLEESKPIMEVYNILIDEGGYQ